MHRCNGPPGNAASGPHHSLSSRLDAPCIGDVRPNKQPSGRLETLKHPFYGFGKVCHIVQRH